MWRSTFVPETILRRKERVGRSRQTHSHERNWARRRTFHELHSLSLVLSWKVQVRRLDLALVCQAEKYLNWLPAAVQSSVFPIENFPTVLLHLQHHSLQSIVLGSIQTAWGWREIFVSPHQFRSPNIQRLEKIRCVGFKQGHDHTNQDIFETRFFFTRIGLPSRRNQWNRSSIQHLFETTLQSVFSFCIVLFLFFWGTDGIANSCRQLKPDYFEFNWVNSLSLVEFLWTGPK